MHTCMESGMDDEWLGEWMHACIHIWIDACMHAHTGRYVYVQVNMKTDGLKGGGWRAGWMNRYTIDGSEPTEMRSHEYTVLRAMNPQ